MPRDARARCGCCGKRRRGSHPLQTSSATGCCASQVGPVARGAMAFMNKTLGLSLGKITNLFDTLWNLELTPGAARFPATIKSILQCGLRLRDQRDAGERSLRSTRIHATKLAGQLRQLCKSPKRNCANERLAAFLHRRAAHVFAYLRGPDTDATNWRGEHAMRFAVVNRKVWGGNRTRRGADNQAILMSILRTLKLQGIDAIDWLRKKITHQNPPLLA